MGLNTQNGNPLGGLAELMGAFSNLGKLSDAATAAQTRREPELNMNDYFEANRLKDSPLKDEDMITVSVKKDDGYQAAFVTLGDLKKYILGE